MGGAMITRMAAASRLLAAGWPTKRANGAAARRGRQTSGHSRGRCLMPDMTPAVCVQSARPAQIFSFTHARRLRSSSC